MKDALNYWFSGLKEKFSNPVIFTVMWVFVLWNWKSFAILIFDVDQKVGTRIDTFANTDLAFLSPLGLALLLVVVTPFLNILPNFIKDWAEVAYCRIRQWKSNHKVVSAEKFKILEQAFDKVSGERDSLRTNAREFNDRSEKQEQEIEHLQSSIAEKPKLEQEKKELVDELAEITKRLMDTSEQLSEKTEEFIEIKSKLESNQKDKLELLGTIKSLRSHVDLIATTDKGQVDEREKIIKQSIKSMLFLSDQVINRFENKNGTSAHRTPSVINSYTQNIPDYSPLLNNAATNLATELAKQIKPWPHSAVLSNDTIKQLQMAQENIPKVTVPTLDHLINFKKPGSE